MTGAFSRYNDYLHASKDRFPPAAYALATSDWYFNFNDHRSPHDAWVEQIELTESPSTENSRLRLVSLTLRLLGAYHDGFIEFRYPKVFSYSLTLYDGQRGHCDWRYDEFRVSDDGNVIHEIEWSLINDVGHWRIEASDVEYRWLPKS